MVPFCDGIIANQRKTKLTPVKYRRQYIAEAIILFSF